MHRLKGKALALLCSPFLLLLLPGCVKAQQVFDDLSSGPLGLIHFKSVTPASRFALAHRGDAAPPTVIWGTLAVPATAGVLKP